MTTTKTTVMAEVRPGQYQPDPGRPVLFSLREVAARLGVSESSVRRAIARSGFRGRVAGPSVAGMLELWLDFGDAAGSSVFVAYHDSTSHPMTAEQLAR